MPRSGAVWLISLTALLACAIFVVHHEAETADEVITQAWLSDEVKAKVDADRTAREVAAAEAKAKAEVALEIMKKATQNALGIEPHLSIATIGLPAPAETATAVKQVPPAPKKVKPAEKPQHDKPHEAKQPPAKEKKKKPRVDLSALAHAAFGMIGDEASDDGPATSMDERKAELQAEDDLGVADHLDHFTHEQEKLGRVRASQGRASSKKPMVKRALGSKDLDALFDSHVHKAKTAVPKRKQQKVKKLSAAQRRAMERKKRKVEEAKQHAANQKVDLLRQATQKWTHRVTRVQAPPSPPVPRKVKAVHPAECHPPECLPSGIESKRKHKKQARHSKRHHSDELVPEALTIESFDEHIARERADRAEAARHKRHVQKVKHDREVHRERSRKKRRREAGEKVAREKAALKYVAQKKARDQALEDISHRTDKYWVEHGAGWTREGGNVVPTTKRLKEALKRATKRHLAENEMKAALEQAANTATQRAEKQSRQKFDARAHRHMSKKELMHQLLDQDVQLVHKKRHRQQAAREAAVQEARAAREAAKQSAKHAQQAKAQAATSSTRQALQALAAKHAKKSKTRTRAAVDHRATSEKDLIKMLAQEDLNGGH